MSVFGSSDGTRRGKKKRRTRHGAGDGEDLEDLETGSRGSLFGLVPAVSLGEGPTAFVGESAEARKLLFVPGHEDPADGDDGAGSDAAARPHAAAHQRRRQADKRRSAAPRKHAPAAAPATVVSAAGVAPPAGAEAVGAAGEGAAAAAAGTAVQQPGAGAAQDELRRRRRDTLQPDPLSPRRDRERDGAGAGAGDDREALQLTRAERRIVWWLPKVTCALWGVVAYAVQWHLPLLAFVKVRGEYTLVLMLDAAVACAAELVWRLVLEHFRAYVATLAGAVALFLAGLLPLAGVYLRLRDAAPSSLFVPLVAVMAAGRAGVPPVCDAVVRVLSRNTFVDALCYYGGKVLMGASFLFYVSQLMRSNGHSDRDALNSSFALTTCLVTAAAVALVAAFCPLFFRVRTYFARRKAALERVQRDDLAIKNRMLRNSRSSSRSRSGGLAVTSSSSGGSGGTRTHTRFGLTTRSARLRRALRNTTFAAYTAVLVVHGFCLGTEAIRVMYYIESDTEVLSRGIFHYKLYAAAAICASVNDLLVLVLHWLVLARARAETVTLAVLGGTVAYHAMYTFLATNHGYAVLGDLLFSGLAQFPVAFNAEAVARTYAPQGADGAARTVFHLAHRGAGTLLGILVASACFFRTNSSELPFAVSALTAAVAAVLFVFELFYSRRRAQHSDVARHSALRSAIALAAAEEGETTAERAIASRASNLYNEAHELGASELRTSLAPRTDERQPFLSDPTVAAPPAAPYEPPTIES